MTKIFQVFLAPSWRLEMPSAVFLDLPEEPPSTQEQPWSDLEISRSKRKKRPDEAQEHPEFRF
jgi:hypothetical protein